MSMIGKKAPEWKGAAYVNGEEKIISSHDYEGKWYVLYWYPLDFTFVCPTEIRGFEALLEEFEDEGVSIIGASTDSWHSHKCWFADRETFEQEITHPVIADTNHKLSKKFKVLKKDSGIAYRATVIVDDQGIIRSYSVNDLSLGRSPKETLRAIHALKSGGLCGADWKKGDDFAI
ncbi:peroxiredoxin [Ostreibacterium oceani]|uniref:Alkyl hydroperoxide reductase C n=1 Tax=Ostreibacterium oceani TaxID=2654998 RepID=A0A6N7EZD0_9GAMM|nr:peroxiredoxin [Ostreibacterium oceani]MPV86729.1 redoxin domain-containing protein [Ostreibacterium oceani]